ncbi:MAG: 50S ribosomal protein L21 [Chloroflexi bacterium]|nr:50S ribosomal protein L21 [Chloroflexota bacterium]
MRYAIVESGGKQYRAVEGSIVEVDRLAREIGKKVDLEHVLFMGDGDEVHVGAPLVSGVKVTATVLEHVRGPKVLSFRYRPKKRIRTKSGHRQEYTRLMIEFIGRPGEDRKVERSSEKKEPPTPKKERSTEVSKTTAEKTSEIKTGRKPASRSVPKKSDAKKK